MRLCEICEQKRAKNSFDFYDYKVIICENCGVRFLDPQPTDEELSRIYSNSYFLGGDDPLNRELVNLMKRNTARLYLDQLIKEVGLKNESNSCSLLEIGCGMGDFLLEAQANGFKVSGLEVSDYLVELTNHRLGSNCVEKGVIETSNFSPQSFDIITFFDVIEHVRNPISFLKKVNELLNNSGKLFLVTPSLDSWSARLMGKNWMEYKIEHLFYFNKKSLKLLLEQAGFHNIRFIPNHKILNIDYIHRHFVRFPIRGFTSFLSMIRKVVPSRIAYTPIKLIASGIGVIAEK